MLNFRFKIFTLLFLISVVFQPTYARETSSQIAFVVNKSIITVAELNNRLKLAAVSSGLPPTKENLERIKPQVVRLMINERIQLQQAKTYKITIDDETIKKEIARLEESNGMPEGTVNHMLKENAIPAHILKNQLESNLAWVVYIQSRYQPTIQVSEAEIEQEVKKSKENLDKTHYHLAELVLLVDSPDQERQAASDIQKLSQDIHKSRQFRAIAQQFSQSATKSNGGDLGWLTEDQISPEVLAQVQKLKPGEISSPIRTPAGYTIIALIAKRGCGAAEESLITVAQALIPYPSTPTNEIVGEVLNQALSIRKASSTCPAFIKRLKSHPANKVQLIAKTTADNFPQAVQDILSSLGTNQISKPIPTQDGVIMFMVCSREVNKPEEITPEQAKTALIQKRLALISQRELRNLRHQAFIEIRR